MEIISNTIDFHMPHPTAVAIGKFDGIHLGHRSLIQEILKQKEKNLRACIFTFDPPPAVLFGIGDGKELTTKEEKRRIFAGMGIDILIEFPLNRENAAIPAEVFLQEILLKQMQMRFITAGEDLTFGAGGKGNADLLKEKAEAYGYTPCVIEKVRYGDEIISSSYIRKQVEAGNMPLVTQLLSMPYTVIGRVSHGKQLGRRLGMPTVNIIPPVSKLLPPCGVYYSTVRFKDKEYRAISNVGYKPTVTEEHVMGLETYLYDFCEEIYGEEIEVRLHEFKRPERQFCDIVALKAQLEEDIRMGAVWKG